MQTGDVPIITNPKDVNKLMSPNAASIIDEAVVNPELTPQMAETLRLMKEAEAEKAKRLSASPLELSKPQTQEQKPIELTYRFIGNCKCGQEPMTIMVDTPAGLYANAVCISENKQLKSIKVEKLETEFKMISFNSSVESIKPLPAAPIPNGIIKKKK